MQCPSRQTFTNGLFIPGMNIILVSNIRSNNHPGMGYSLHTIPLRFADHRILAFVGRYLYKIKGHIRMGKLAAPILYHSWKQAAVLPGILGIGFTLVPYYAFEAITQ